jgi:hypothetical protein
MRSNHFSFLFILSITDKRWWLSGLSHSTFPIVLLLLYKFHPESRDSPSFDVSLLKCVLDNLDLESSFEIRLLNDVLPACLFLHIQLPSARGVVRPFLSRLFATLRRRFPSRFRDAKQFHLSYFGLGQSLSDASENFLSHFLQVLEAHAVMEGACTECRLPTFSSYENFFKQRLQSPSLFCVRPPASPSLLPDAFFAYSRWPEKKEVGVKMMVARKTVFGGTVIVLPHKDHNDESSSYINA